MTGSRFSSVTRRRLAISSFVASVVAATSGLDLLTSLAGADLGTPEAAPPPDPFTGTWNWGGNAGHTDELPGPGLDLNGALGEVWRVSRDEFGETDAINAAAYSNGVIYSINGDSLWARRLSDGAFLWSQSPAKVAATPSVVASPSAVGEDVSFAFGITIDDDLLLVPVSNGHLWALNARTGDVRWDFDSGSDVIGAPTVVDHVAYCRTGGGVCAIALGDAPTLRWTSDVGAGVIGIADGYVYVVGHGDDQEHPVIHALTVEDGSEFWRTSPDAFPAGYAVAAAIVDGSVFAVMIDRESDGMSLFLIDNTGSVAWKRAANSDDWQSTWLSQDLAIRLSGDDDESFGIRGLLLDNGQPSWTMEVYPGRWDADDYPIVCAGFAYASAYDEVNDQNILLAIDLANNTVFGAPGVDVTPLFLADGMMLARDNDTDDILAIGTVPPTLRSGGRAKVTKDATLRGAPSETAIERTKVTSGTEVDITGESETTKGVAWAPVTVPDTKASGWLPTDVLAGLDGSISFTSMRLETFGTFTSYPKFASGTKAEITEKIAMRGAPSDTAAKKSTLTPGTLVTVTSAPTKVGDVEWASITVDATNERGWVPTSVLKLVPNS